MLCWPVEHPVLHPGISLLTTDGSLRPENMAWHLFLSMLPIYSTNVPNLLYLAAYITHLKIPPFWTVCMICLNEENSLVVKCSNSYDLRKSLNILPDRPNIDLGRSSLAHRAAITWIHYWIIKDTFPFQLLLKTGLKGKKRCCKYKFWKGGGSVVYNKNSNSYYFWYIMTHLYLHSFCFLFKTLLLFYIYLSFILKYSKSTSVVILPFLTYLLYKDMIWWWWWWWWWWSS